MQYTLARPPRRLLLSEQDVLEKLLPKLFASTTDGRSITGELSAYFGYSQRQMRREFSALFGEPVGSFVRRLRIEHAAGCLVHERRTVADIADGAGFSTSEAFAKAFRLHFSLSPSEFRGLNQGSECNFPGYLLCWPRQVSFASNVQVKAGPGQVVTFVYDELVLLAKVLAPGVVDWCPHRRRT